MPETAPEKKKGAPTEKMVDAGKKAAERHGVPLPKGFATDYDICKVFLDAYLNKPSPKALSFAQKIASTKGLTIPAETLISGKDLSVWIDANKA